MGNILEDSKDIDTRKQGELPLSLLLFILLVSLLSLRVIRLGGLQQDLTDKHKICLVPSPTSSLPHFLSRLRAGPISSPASIASIVFMSISFRSAHMAATCSTSDGGTATTPS
jgi:hypothetical protein